MKKSQQPQLITLAVADEKPEGGGGGGVQKEEERVKIIRNFQLECLRSLSLNKQ